MAAKIAAAINDKSKKGAVEIKSAVVKQNIWVFVKATIVNPNFDT